MQHFIYPYGLIILLGLCGLHSCTQKATSQGTANKEVGSLERAEPGGAAPVCAVAGIRSLAEKRSTKSARLQTEVQTGFRARCATH